MFQIKKNSQTGIHLVSTVEIPPGTVILNERPVAISKSVEFCHSEKYNFSFIWSLVEEFCEIKTIREVKELCMSDCSKSLGMTRWEGHKDDKVATRISSKLGIPLFYIKQVYDIFVTNNLAAELTIKTVNCVNFATASRRAFFSTLSRCDHSCASNCSLKISSYPAESHDVSLVSKCTIPAGCPLTINYYPTPEEFFNYCHFMCCCFVCTGACASCGNPNPRLMCPCSAKLRYCSTECQQNHWPAHRSLHTGQESRENRLRQKFLNGMYHAAEQKKKKEDNVITPYGT